METVKCVTSKHYRVLPQNVEYKIISFQKTHIKRYYIRFDAISCGEAIFNSETAKWNKQYIKIDEKTDP